MRLIHTSDWHLGRHLCGECLLDDQAYVLEQLVGLARDFRPDLLIVSGDLYDRAVPSANGVELLDEVLSRLILDLGLDVLLLAGNHDSRERLSFAARLLTRNRLHIAAAPEPFRILSLADDHGPVEVLALSYLEPAEARDFLGRTDLADHDAALRAIIARARSEMHTGRTVLATHAFVSGGLTSESERPLTLGGAGVVEPDCFDGFSYVALGHLHRAQHVGDNRIQYSGAPLKFAFSEANCRKSVTLVELDARGSLNLKRYALQSRREIRCLEGLFDDLLRTPPPGVGRDDLLSITLLDERPVLEAVSRLRETYPNLLQLSQPALVRSPQAGIRPPDHSELDDAELFADFFRQVTGAELDQTERAEVLAAFEDFRRQQEDP